MAIHPLAVVDPTAEVHSEAIIGPFCVVSGPVRIAAGAELRNHVSVYGRTSIGAGSILFPGCVVGSDPQDLKFRGEDSETIIGAGVRIHECATVSKGTASGGMKTVIGDQTLVMAYAHVGHDCIIDNNVVIANNAQIAGHVRVGRKATIGGMVGVHHFATIGELTYIGSMSGVRVDLPPFMIAEGVPAEPRNINVVGCRRDGMSEDTIRRLRDAYKIIYFDREKNGMPLQEALDKARDLIGSEPTCPVARLITWQREHLEQNIKGRVQEAHRAPAVGGSSKAQVPPA
jgi:UDP-N-acetylglucosamine acyltransferase